MLRHSIFILNTLRGLFVATAYKHQEQKGLPLPAQLSRSHKDKGGCACKDLVERRWEPNQFGNSIPLFGSSLLSQSSFLCLCWHLGGGRCIRCDRCGPSRHLRREWRCRQLLMASSNLQKLISTHPRAAHLLSVILSSSSSTPQKVFLVEISSCHLGHWVWERRNNPGLRKSAY